VTGTITTVDGLFMSLILLTLSGIFYLNAFLELRDRGSLAFLQKKKAGPPKEPPASKVVEARERHGEPPHFPAPSGRITKDFGRCIPKAAPHRHMSARNRFLFFLVAWLIVLMPFLFWWSTWFGRHLSDQQIGEYLNDAKHPRHIQHALVQLGERMEHHDVSAASWYPELVLLSSVPVEEVRNTDAWLMGLDTSYAAFHETLLKMLARLLNHGPRKRGVVSCTLWRRVRPSTDCRPIAARQNRRSKYGPGR